MKELRPINPQISEEEMRDYGEMYFFIKGYAMGKKYYRTLTALAVGRICHMGQKRRLVIDEKGEEVMHPYFRHCLSVCSFLIALDLSMTDDMLDIMYAAALLHDTIEDCKMTGENGEGLLDMGIPMEVVEKVRLLSKQSGADEYALSEYFNEIKKDPITLMIKLADRLDNTDTLYTFKTLTKMKKYITETETWVLPLCTYGKEHYPYLSNAITILKSGIRVNIATIRAILHGLMASKE